MPDEIIKIERKLNVTLNEAPKSESDIQKRVEELNLTLEKSKVEYDKVLLKNKELNAELETTQGNLSTVQTELADVKRQLKEATDGSEWDSLNEKVRNFELTAERAANEVLIHFKKLNLDLDEMYPDADGVMRPIRSYYERVLEGRRTASESITRFNARFSNIAFNGDQGGLADMLQAFVGVSDKIDGLITSMETLLDIVDRIETDGVKTATVVGNTSSEVQDASQMIQTLGTVSEESGEAAKNLVASIAELADKTDIVKLSSISQMFSSIGSVSKVGMGESTINKLVTLVSQLKGLTSDKPLQLNFDFTALKDLSVRKTSLANMADYLPKISNETNVDNLERIAKINWDNYKNLKISKGSLEGIQNFASALDDIYGKLTGGGGNGGGGGGGGGGLLGGLPPIDESLGWLKEIILKKDANGDPHRRTLVYENAIGEEKRLYQVWNAERKAYEDESTQHVIDLKKKEEDATKSALHDIEAETKRFRQEERDEEKRHNEDVKTMQQERTDSEKRRYTELMGYIRQFYRDRLALERGSQKDAALTIGADGRASYAASGANGGEFAATIENYEFVRQKLADLGITYEELTQREKLAFGPDAQANADRLGISLQQYRDLCLDVSKRIGELNEKTAASNAATERAWQKNAAKAHDYYERIREVISKNPEVAELGEKLNKLATEGNPKNLNELTNTMAQFQDAVRRTGADVEAWFQKMRKSFGSRLRSMVSGMAIGYVMRYVRQIYTNVKELDTALTQMRIVTGQTESAINSFADTMARSAQKVGASISDLVNSATTFARLGYTMEEAGQFAELAAEYSKVANTDVNSATTAITTVVKAFGIQASELEGVLDKLMYIGEHFPVSAEELGTGFQNAGSALKAAGNDINQSIALLTAANARVQDISRASTGLRTIAARMTRSETELNELGESLDDVISTPKLQAFMRTFGIEILDAQGELRSTYDILLDLSKVWDDLSSTQRASIAEKLAGTRQQNIFFGLVESMQTEAVGVMNAVSEAEGTLAKANETRLDSIQGRVDQLNASFQQLSNTILDSGLVETFFQLGNYLMQFLDGVAGFGDGILVQLPVLTAGLAVILGLLQKMNVQGGFKLLITGIKNVVNGLRNYTANMVAAEAATEGTTEAMEAQALAAQSAKSAMSAYAAIVAIAITAVVLIINKTNEALEKHNQEMDDAIQNAKDEATAAREEYDELSKLNDELTSAKGNREALIKVYDKLNGRISTSIDLVAGEVNAYQKASVAIKREMAEAEIRAKKAEAAARQAAISKLYGYNIKGSANIGGGATGEDVFKLLRPTSRSYDDFLEAVVMLSQPNSDMDWTDTSLSAFSYDYLTRYKSEAGEENYKKLLEHMGLDPEAFDGFLSSAVESVQAIYKNKIDGLNSNLGESFYNDAIESFVLRGATPEGVDDLINKLSSYAAPLEATVERYYKMISDPGNYTKEQIEKTYHDIYQLVVNLKKQYPDLYDAADVFFLSLEGVVEGLKSTTIESKSILEILNEVQPGFDALSAAMDDMAEAGILSASSLENLLKIEEDLGEMGFELNDYLQQTAEGYKLADDALEQFIKTNITYYSTVGANESAEGRAAALENLKKYRAVLLTLLRDVEKQEKTSGLNKRKDKLKDQLDEYKKLIDLRKKLLETYEDELQYQKELSKKQQGVASLQTKLQQAELDQSAAGRARARELRAQLAEAQDELDDFTLEHAIEVIQNNLDDQYSEYETFINDQIDRIERAIKGVEDAVNDRIDADTLRGLLGLIDEKIMDLAGADDYRYLALKSAGVSVKSASEFSQDDKLGKKYKTWDAYLTALFKRLRNDIKENGLIGGLVEEHHSGGFVGGVKSNETFAKLMNGEFVVTPSQMNNFVNGTLPSITSGNVFHSPLVTIECDNVTSDALPGLQAVVNSAVEEIKKRFDDGMTRSATYVTNRKKLYI